MWLLKRKRKQQPAKQDYRGIPTHACPCGVQVFKVKCIFQNGEIALWFTDAECVGCGALVTAPTPVDDIVN